jgi:hypothetical protein
MNLELRNELEKIALALESFEISLHAVIQSGEPLNGMDILLGLITDKLEMVVSQN